MKKQVVGPNQNLRNLIKLINASRYSDMFSIDKKIGPYNIPLMSGKLKIAIDIRKPFHVKTSVKRKEYKRDSFMTGLGYKVIRFSSVQLYRNPDEVIRVIEEAVATYQIRSSSDN